MGKVRDVQDPVNEGQAEGDQGIGRPQHDSVDQLLKKEVNPIDIRYPQLLDFRFVSEYRRLFELGLVRISFPIPELQSLVHRVYSGFEFRISSILSILLVADPERLCPFSSDHFCSVGDTQLGSIIP